MKMVKRHWAIILVIIVYVILLYNYFSHFNSGYSNNQSNWGTFGDFLGGSLSPIIGIITIFLTYNIINNQSKENKQAEFKNIFQILFDSINGKMEIIERKGRPNLSGKKAISRINKDIESVYKYNKRKNPNSDPLELFRLSFWAVHEDIKGTSSPYMKVLHNCLKAIDKHCMEVRQEAYSSLLRAQLPPDELVFIFYNAIASDDFKNFKSRIEKYSILKDVYDYDFPQELRELYKLNAFVEDKKEAKKMAYRNRVFSFEMKFTFNKR